MSINERQKNVRFDSTRKKCAACGHFRTENITMHKMPKNKKIKNLWCKAVNKELKYSDVICSNHFNKTDYRINWIKKPKGLKPNAVPTQFDSVESQTFLETVNSWYKDLTNQQVADNRSKNCWSDQKNKCINAEEELCYVYYLDEKQNVGVFKSSPRLDCTESIYNRLNESNQPINSFNTEIHQENVVLNMNFDETQSNHESCSEEKSLKVNNIASMAILQSGSLEPFIGLDSSNFTTKHAWQTFCNIISEYRTQIYDLQDNNNILQTKVDRLKKLLNIHINRI